jgi:preprotein translocase subunit SecF
MEIVSSIVKDQLNRFIIEMGDFAMKKKTIIISGIAAVLVIGSGGFCFAVKGDGTQPADVAQTVTEAVATPSIEVTQETTEEVSEETSSEVSESEVEETEVVEEVPKVEVQETTEEVSSIVDVAETTEEVSEDAGVSTQTEEAKPVEPKQEEVKPAETKPVETQPVQAQPTETQPQQTTVDAQRDAILAQMAADGALDYIPDSTSVLGNYSGNAGAGLQWE